jgi:lipopolysaccharide transport system ATP-binding protein
MDVQDAAVTFEGVEKRYQLHSDPRRRMVDALGLGGLAPRRRAPAEFRALHDIDLTVRGGERVGFIGRNGAGKTTLLKLICGNFMPSAGTVHVQGRVRALMDLGLGFHPDFSGRDNIRSALAYNGLPSQEFERAIAEIVEFCELGDFLDQPLSTYSAGMRARLYFAAATAVQPEILIIDEVLGAGDSYFVVRSAERMRRLTESGCTLLLVSHSMKQILDFCERAVWLHEGGIVRDGPAEAVIEDYNAFIRSLEAGQTPKTSDTPAPARATPKAEERWVQARVAEIGPAHILDLPVAHVAGGEAASVDLAIGAPSVRRPGCAATLEGIVTSGEAATISFTVWSARPRNLELIPAICVFAIDGRLATRQVAAADQVGISAGSGRRYEARYDPLLLGPGEYLALALAAVREHGADSGWGIVTSPACRFEVRHLDRTEGSLLLHPTRWHFPDPETAERSTAAAGTGLQSAATE